MTTATAGQPHRPHPHLRRQRHQGLLRESGSQREGLHRLTAGCAPAISECCRDGKLYITGRAKEIIFVNGQNYYPHDIESIAQPRRRPRARQGRGGGRATQGREHRRSHHLRAASHGHEGVPAARDAGRAAGQRAHGPRSGARGAGEAHPEDHQRQDPAPPARRRLRERRVRRGARRAGQRCARQRKRRVARRLTSNRDRTAASRTSAMRRWSATSTSTTTCSRSARAR